MRLLEVNNNKSMHVARGLKMRLFETNKTQKIHIFFSIINFTLQLKSPEV